MAKDIVYYFDKVSGSGLGINGAIGHELGEIQADFNMSFTIDGTKDSCKIKVLSFTDYELEPYTIIWHFVTDTWWIVKKDKVERHQNESGFFYVHNIELNGAIELLNARDLTDCAFNSKRYTIGQVASRLFNLSNFEFVASFNYQYNVISSKIVDYVKTFQNYSLLSALREFFNGYNCSLKMTFSPIYTGGVYHIYTANIIVNSKSGNINDDVIDIDAFDDVRAVKNIDSNSFGTTVMSNAENVISTKAKTYPVVGAISPSAKTYEIEANASAGVTTNNAIIRLPTPAYTVNWVKVWANTISMAIVRNNETKIVIIDVFNKESSRDKFETQINQYINDFPAEEQDLLSLLNDFDDIFESVLKYCTVTFYNGVIYNPDDTFTIPNSVPYMPRFSYTGGEGIGTNRQFGLFPKEVQQALKRPWQGMAWERGSDIIEGLLMFSQQDGLTYDYLEFNDADEHTGLIKTQGAYEIWSYPKGGSNDHDRKFELTQYNKNLRFSINYIPMLDLKIKVENQNDKRDIHIYNQNGKFIDSVALSKLLNSYADEISTDNITRYMSYYSFSNVPKAGTIVDNNGTKYIINNVSVDFNQCEQNGSVSYFIQAEFSLSKAVAVKSININANSNIRDYGIPQANTVIRKQLYRDYYELALNYDTSSDINWFLPLEKELYLTNALKQDRQAIMKITWSTGDTYYYQLPAEIFPLKKQVIEVVTFKDNNIIGYTSQNVKTGFDLTRLFQNIGVVVPISYTDYSGAFESIEIKMVKPYDLEKAFDDYCVSQSESRSSAGYLMNYPFMPQYVYDYVVTNGLVEYTISNIDYKKDPLEVPMFEHITQLNNSEEVIVGNNIFDDYSDNRSLIMLYAWGYAPKNKANEYNAEFFVEEEPEVTDDNFPYPFELYHSCELWYTTKNSHKVLAINLYEYYRSTTGFENSIAVNDDYDLVIFRIAYSPLTKKVIAKDLMFVIKVNENAEYTTNEGIYIYINHYKVSK